MLAQGVCIGLGSGCLFIPSVGIIPTYFSTRKTLAMGLAASGSSIAGIFGTRMGMSTLCAGLGTSVGNPVAGAIVESRSWVGVSLFCACALVVGTIFVAGARDVRSRRVMEQV